MYDFLIKFTNKDTLAIFVSSPWLTIQVFTEVLNKFLCYCLVLPKRLGTFRVQKVIMWNVFFFFSTLYSTFIQEWLTHCRGNIRMLWGDSFIATRVGLCRSFHSPYPDSTSTDLLITSVFLYGKMWHREIWRIPLCFPYQEGGVCLL